MKEEQGNKFSARYDHRPYRVIAIKGTRATAERGGVQGARRVLHPKPYNWPFPEEPHDLSDLDEEDEERANPEPQKERCYPLSERRCPDYYFEEHDSLLTWNSVSDLIWVIENKRNYNGKPCRKDAWCTHYDLVAFSSDFFLRVREGCNH